MQPRQNLSSKVLVLFFITVLISFGCVSRSDYELNAGVIKVSQWFHDFDKVAVGYSAEVAINIENIGPKTIEITALGLAKSGGTGNDPGSNELTYGYFLISEVLDNAVDPANPLPLPISDAIYIDKDQSITIKIQFNPNTINPAVACLEITQDAINDKPAIIEFRGNCYGGSTPSYLIFDPDSYDFQMHPIGSRTSKKFTINNATNTDITITNLEMTGTNPDQFELTEFTDSDHVVLSMPSVNAPIKLSPGDLLFITIEFVPTSGGVHISYLTATSDAGGVPDTETKVQIIGTVNRIPIIENAQAAPEVVAANGTDKVIFSVKVTDPDGKSDIDLVSVDLLDIDGNAAQQLYDDGLNGDKMSDDNVYSFEYTIPYNATLYGTYEIEFFAEDKGGETASAKAYLAVATGKVIHVSASRGADDEGYWRYKSPMPTARRYASCVIYNNKIYVIGGCGSNSSNYYK
ncbi:MAG: choice-of-anchor D domain-containing protein, partial [Planctomycetes bacterium]|nr:choice-of-anchor D domain-containing protein [Planctomycetota bacterium]